MPFYSTSPAGPRAMLASPGSVTYLLGARAPEGGLMYITAVSITANVATVNVMSFSGALPVVGTKVTIRGTSQQSGAYNVTNAVVTAVSLNAAGVGTVTFALTGTTQTSTADGGTLSFLPQTAGETVAAAGTTMPASDAFNQGRSSNNWFYELLPDSVAALPTAATITPQHALVNEDAAYSDISGAPVGTIAGTAITASGGNFSTEAPFVRFRISGVTGSGNVALGVTI